MQVLNGEPNSIQIFEELCFAIVCMKSNKRTNLNKVSGNNYRPFLERISSMASGLRPLIILYSYPFPDFFTSITPG